MIDKGIHISYFVRDDVFIPSKFINMKEEGEKVLRWAMSHFLVIIHESLVGRNDEKFLESGLAGFYRVVMVLSLNVVF